MNAAALRHWRRRARPLLGTLVEIGVPAHAPAAAEDAGFAAVERVQRCLSRFASASDIGRFNQAAAGAVVHLQADTHCVLAAALTLQVATHGGFDVSLGSGLRPEHLQHTQLHKPHAATRIDLGGIGKGYAVDAAVQALQVAGCAGGWVNAGGDLRAFGCAELPVQRRDERHGGVRPFATLADGALASSCYSSNSASALWDAGGKTISCYVTVAAPLALWADALTKVVALTDNPEHPLLAAHGACAWHH